MESDTVSKTTALYRQASCVMNKNQQDYANEILPFNTITTAKLFPHGCTSSCHKGRSLYQ